MFDKFQATIQSAASAAFLDCVNFQAVDETTVLHANDGGPGAPLGLGPLDLVFLKTVLAAHAD